MFCVMFFSRWKITGVKPEANTKFVKIFAKQMFQLIWQVHLELGNQHSVCAACERFQNKCIAPIQHSKNIFAKARDSKERRFHITNIHVHTAEQSTHEQKKKDI